MKHFLFLACIVMLIAACRKVEEENETGAPIVSLTGKWELRAIYGNIANCCNYAPGNGSILIFNGNRYEKYEKNQLTKTGSYLTVPDSTVALSTCTNIPAGSFPTRLIYDSNFIATKIFYEIRKGKLVFISGCYAGDAGHSDVYDPVK